MKNSTKKMVDFLIENHAENYLIEHTLKNTQEYFNVTERALEIFCEVLEINRPGKGGNNSKVSKENLDNRIKELNQNEIIDYYQSHSRVQTIKEFNISNLVLNKILEINRIKPHTKTENTILFNKSVYGVENVSQVDEIKQKSFNSKLKKYGNPKFVNPEKAKQTNLSKYGVTCSAQAEEVKEKIKKTNLEKFGAVHPWLTEDSQLKCIETKLNNYWTKTEYTEEYKVLRHNRELSIKFLTENQLNRDDLAKRFNCTRSSIQTWIRSLQLFDYVKELEPFSGTSNFESEVKGYIKSITDGLIIEHDRSILNGKEIDLYIPSKKIGIECNGDYWHSDLYKPKKYHLDKTLLAETKEIRLISIYQHEWEEYPEKIKSLLNIALGNISNKIYARQCVIKKISNKEAKPFNQMNHIQGHRDAKITYGLFYKNELVQLMSFSKHPKFEWEIIRGCPASNNIVIGGVSKLFNYFLGEFNPHYVFSYCDFNKFDGHGYEKIGMKFIGYTGPDKKWLMQDGSVVNRSAHKYKQLKDLSRAIIWGAGSKKYLWTNEIYN